MNYLIVIVGPTAIGKTSLSIKLANYFGGDILSCDSRQFYKEMTIGTAVPSARELAAAQHHFIQNKTIFENYTVGDFEKEAVKLLDKLFKKNNIQIMVGGSGLYVKAVLEGFDDFPTIAPDVRAILNTHFETLGIEFLQEELKQNDRSYYDYLLKNNPQTLQNPQRMKRFVEICHGSGEPYSSFINLKKNRRYFTPILIGLEADRNTIYDRINQRVDSMMQQGLLEEVQKLLPQKSLNALQTVGYKELFDYLDNKTTLDVAIEEIKKNTRRFAKRQLTWFKRSEDITWLDYETPFTEVIEKIKLKIK